MLLYKGERNFSNRKKMKLFLNIYVNYILLGVIEFHKYIEIWTVRKNHKGKIHIFRKGSGVLNKYILTREKELFLIKRTNKFIEHRVFILGKIKQINEENMSRRISLLKSLKNNPFIKKNTPLYQINKKEIIYTYYPTAKEVTNKLPSEKKRKIIKLIDEFILFLSSKKLVTEELYLHNIILVDDKPLLIDLEGIVSTKKTNMHKQYMQIKKELK